MILAKEEDGGAGVISLFVLHMQSGVDTNDYELTNHSKHPVERVQSVRRATSENCLFLFVITVFMMILVLVLPFAYRVDIGPGPDSIRAMTWDYIESSWYTGFRFWNPLDMLPYTFLRLVFAAYLARFCLGFSSAKRTILTGILAELQPFIVSALQVYIIDWAGDPLVPLYIPIPIMVTLGIILVLFLMHRQTND